MNFPGLASGNRLNIHEALKNTFCRFSEFFFIEIKFESIERVYKKMIINFDSSFY